MGSDALANYRVRFNVCFNPHSHMGSDAVCFWQIWSMLVSIHTPTWGVTNDMYVSSKQMKFTSQTPKRGLTQHRCTMLPFLCFNPHSHMGSDFGIPTNFKGGFDVSIHTPTWGVTLHNISIMSL